MRIRVRGPEGQSTLTFADTATVGELVSQLSKATSIGRLEIKCGYPPRPLQLDEFESATRLSDIGIDIDGEQLIVSRAQDDVDEGASQTSEPPPNSLGQDMKTSSNGANESSNSETPTSSSSIAGVSVPRRESNNRHPKAQTARSNKPLALSRKAPSTEPPEVALPSHGSTLILRIMPDDNSCLFRAFGNAFLPDMDNMTELRSIIAQYIQSHPETYSAVVLDQKPDDYCRWIQTPDAWGGAIELDILSRHFELEICSIDVQTCRVDRFNEGRDQRCILVYSGIHYDTIALSPAEGGVFAPPEFDTKVFEAADEEVLEKAVELCRVLQGRHYFTDTAKFSIRCNTCRKTFTGERGATEHAKETGHYDFGESG